MSPNSGSNGRNGRKGRAGGKNGSGGNRGHKRPQTHPGGTGATVGVHLLRFSGAQGLTLAASNILHYGSIIAVGWLLGSGKLGAFSLLFFYTSLLAQVVHMATKPGTFRRVFGTGGEDEDEIDGEDDEDDDEELSKNPPRTLGVGIAWTFLLSGIILVPTIYWQHKISRWLLGTPKDGHLILLASITAVFYALFRLCELVVWFERRPLGYAVADISRPLFNLIGLIVMVGGFGLGIEGAIIGQTVGTTSAALLTLWMIRKSFVPAFSLGETWEIFKRGKARIPIASSMWAIQNADSYILSRFVAHSQLGLYQFASRTGLIVSLLPQGFRVALRPMKKTAAYRELRRAYGKNVAQGQLLTYFLLLCLTAVLAMVMMGELLITVAPPSFQSAAPLIPVSAAAMVMPSAFRTISGMSIIENRRRMFILSVVGSGFAYVGLMFLLGPILKIYSPGVSMMIVFLIPALAFLWRGQRGPDPLDIAWGALGKATAIAIVLGVGFWAVHPANKWAQLGLAAILMILWFVLLVVTRVVPLHHRAPLWHMLKSSFKGSALQFNARQGLRAIEPAQREALHEAAVKQLAPGELGDHGHQPGSFIPGQNGDDEAEERGRALVATLRKVGRKGGVPVDRVTELDAGIALYLFAREPTASRIARMRTLASNGGKPSDLQTLEELVDQLHKTPDDVWAGERPSGIRARAALRVRRAVTFLSRRIRRRRGRALLKRA